MNKRKGFALVELLVSAGLFIMSLSFFYQFLKIAMEHTVSDKKYSCALYEARDLMEKRRLIPVSAEIEALEITVDWSPEHLPIRLYTLRSKY